MGQLLVRNLDDSVIETLKKRAAAAHTSLEQVARTVLTEAAKPTRAEIWAEIDRLRKENGPVTLDPTVLIREDRDSR